jgi:hypothetical protein
MQQNHRTLNAMHADSPAAAGPVTGGIPHSNVVSSPSEHASYGSVTSFDRHDIAPHSLGPAGRVPGTAYVTGAYLASGDPSIDRMVALELALKRHGNPA